MQNIKGQAGLSFNKFDPYIILENSDMFRFACIYSFFHYRL